MTSLELEVLYAGRSLKVFGVVQDGVCLPSKWLTGLGSLPQAQFRARLERLTEVGYLRSPEEMRVLQCSVSPPISEIKVRSGFRLYVLQDGENWIATHGAKKPHDRKVCKEAVRAVEIWKGAHTQ